MRAHGDKVLLSGNRTALPELALVGAGKKARRARSHPTIASDLDVAHTTFEHGPAYSFGSHGFLVSLPHAVTDLFSDNVVNGTPFSGVTVEKKDAAIGAGE